MSYNKNYRTSERISISDYMNWSLKPLPPNNPLKYTFPKWEEKYRYHLNKIYQNIMIYANKNSIDDFFKNLNYTQFSYYMYQNSYLVKKDKSLWIPEFDNFNDII